MSTMQSLAAISVASEDSGANRMREWEMDVGVRRNFRVDPSNAGAKKVFLNCHYCGYAPPDGLPTEGGCPKCSSNSWDRFALSTRLLPRHMR